MALIRQPIETLDQWHQSAIIGWGSETSLRGPCLTGQPINNDGPALHVLGRVELHPAFLWLLMALCQAFSRNFPYIRTRLTLEYEIELFFSNPSIKT